MREFIKSARPGKGRSRQKGISDKRFCSRNMKVPGCQKEQVLRGDGLVEFVLDPFECPTYSTVAIVCSKGSIPDGIYKVFFKARTERVTHEIDVEAYGPRLVFLFDFKYAKAHSLLFDVVISGISHNVLTFRCISDATDVAKKGLNSRGFYPKQTLDKAKPVPKETDVPYIVNLMAVVDYVEGLEYIKDELKMDVTGCWEETGQNLLHVGVAFNNLKVVEYGLNMNLDPHLKNKAGQSPKMLAQMIPKDSKIRELLDHA